MKALFVGGRYNKMIIDETELEKLDGFNGKYSEDCSELRARGLCVHRKELDNRPQIEGYLGPMWDGDKLRYETQEVYDMLSR